MGKGSKKKNPSKTALRLERFPYEYVIDLNATKAAIRCGCSSRSARTLGARLFANVDVKATIKELQEASKEKALMKADEVEAELDALVRFNLRDFVHDDGTPKEIHELTREQAACIKEFESMKTPLGISRNLKFFDKVQSIRTKMQRLGMLKDIHEVITESYAERMKRLGAGKKA